MLAPGLCPGGSVRTGVGRESGAFYCISNSRARSENGEVGALGFKGVLRAVMS